jgi:glycosyltransferase involved in cell wall biosynthesis
MMPNNLHITMNSFRYGSRILKETASLLQSGLVQHIYIAALHEEGLDEHEVIDKGRSVWRARLKSRKWPRSLPIQLVKYMEFCMKVILYARRRNIKVINIHSLALLPLGVFLKWILGAKLVYDAHELETETYGMRGLRQVIARHVERMLIKYASLIIVVGDGINDWYRDTYGLSNIVTVLNCPEFQEHRNTKRFHNELGIPEGEKIVLYQGGLVGGRGVEQLLKIFSEYGDDRHVLVLMGYGELESLIKEYVESHGNVYFQEAVPPSVVLQYTASADVGISYIDNASLNDRFCLPNKLFEYIMAGLPVIVNNAPEMRRVVIENKIGIVLSELTPESLKQALDELARIDAGELKENIKNAASKFSWQNQERVMIDAYKKYLFQKA